MKKVIILQGLPASGKSTWAKETIEKNPGQYKRINKDDLRAMLDNSNWSGDNEKFIIKTRNSMILGALESGKHVIVDDTNFHLKHITAITELVKGIAKVEIKPFEISLHEAIERDLKRENSVGEGVIRKMWKQFIQPDIERYLIEDGTYAIIVDVDGTLAHGIGALRGPYDWDKVGSDRPNTPVIDIVKRYNNDPGVKVIIVTGRDGSCEQLTKDWLQKYGVKWDEFYIRPEGNTEKDAVIKKRIYEEHIVDKYNVLFVLDDRKQVVDMWRELGLDCLQVDYGDF